MTVLGPDISSFQHGLDLAACGSASFVIAKTTEGTYYTDADYQSWRQQSARLGRLFVWYHFLSGEDPRAQVQHAIANIGDAALPGMLDFEPEDTFHPTLAQAIAYIDAAHSAGLNLRLVYLPRWYWQQLGSPDLAPLRQRGVYLVSSSYPGGDGSPSQLYPGDSATGWAPYGGMQPLLYQFTDKATDGGQLLDYNAFRGSTAQLAGYLAISTSTPSAGGTTMGTIPPSIGQKWPNLADQFPAGQSFDNDTALIWSDAGARAAAFYAQQALALEQANAAKLDQLLARPVAAPPVDVNALATALSPLMNAAASPDEVARAVVAHLGLTVSVVAK